MTRRLPDEMVYRSVAYLGVLVILCAPLYSVDREHPGARTITVSDAIAMTAIADASSSGSPAIFSPDGTRCLILLKQGNINRNTNEFRLLLWSTSRLFSSAKAKIALSMSSSSNRPAIEQVAWLSDNKTIVFLGEHPSELHQLFKFDLQARILTRLTHHLTNLLSYSITPDGKTIVYLAEQPAKQLFGRSNERNGLVISSQSFYNLASGTTGGTSSDPELWAISAGSRPRKLQTRDGIASCCGARMSLSPNGRLLAIKLNPRYIPPEWKDYSERFVRIAAGWKVAPGGHSSLQVYAIVDMNTGTDRWLVDAPIVSPGLQVAWSCDSGSLVIAGSYLPLGGTSPEERENRRSKTFTFEVAVRDSSITPISEGGVRIGQCNCFAKFIDIEMATFHTIFQKQHGSWGPHPTPKDNRFTITVDEGPNSPPKILVKDATTNREGVLLDPNPQFKDLRFARVTEIHWGGTDGKAYTGGLYFPINYIKGVRYPLVIQTHGWSGERFWIDGPFTTAFAAQSLAAKGIFVLQTPDLRDDFKIPQESKANMVMFEEALDYLSTENLIDLDRIGIIGFSRSCFHVKYAITHSRYHFAAASVTDGFDAGYLQYILSLPFSPSFTEDVEGVRGGTPFSPDSVPWTTTSPMSNIGQLETPLRINALTPFSALSEWEWFAALSRLEKPVELIVIGDGSHILERPWDRLVSQEGNVEWFSFWLKGAEEPGDEKASQYKRWRDMREHLASQHEKYPPVPK